MSFGLQTFKEDGSVDFDPNTPLMKVIHRQTVTENTSITIQNYPPPYFVILLSSFNDEVRHVSPVTHNQSGNTVNIVYHVYVGYRFEEGDPEPGYYPSKNFPATVLVCK